MFSAQTKFILKTIHIAPMMYYFLLELTMIEATINHSPSALSQSQKRLLDSAMVNDLINSL